MKRLVAILASSVILAAGCAPTSSGPPATNPPASTSSEPGVAPPFWDITSYKVGPDRLGVHPGPGPANEPVVLWQVDLPSGLVAAPLIVDGTVIAISEDGTVRGIDGATGAEAWTGAFPSGVSITPTIANGTLYSVTVDGVLRTMSLVDRSLGWTAEGFLVDTQVNVAGDLVVAGAPGEIVALSAADGAERWRVEAAGSGRIAVDAERVYVSGTGSGTMQALTLADGGPNWNLDTTSAAVLTPGVSGGTVYVAARDVAGGQNITYALGPDGRELWHFTGPDIIASASVTDDRVFVSIDDPTTGIIALDRATGAVAWRRELPGGILGLLAAADGALYLPTTDDGVIAIDAGTGEIRWRAAMERSMVAQLAVSGGLVFVGSQWADGSGQLTALADPSDPRIGHTVTATPPASAGPSKVPSAALRILSADDVEGETLLISTAVGPDGTMYVTDMLNSRVVVRAPDGTIESWGEYGSEPGQFNFSEVTRNDSAGGVAVSPDGELIAVGDGHNFRVQLFDGDREFIRIIGRQGRGVGQFVNPCCVAVDAEHRIWVVDDGRDDIQVFSEKGEHLLTFAGPGHGDGQLSRASGLFVDAASDRVYVADFANRRVAVFTTDGTWVRNYGGDMGGGVRLDEVNTVAVDRAGRLFVLDTTSSVFVIEPDGTPIAVIDRTEPDLGFAEAATFAIDDAGRMYYGEIREDGPANLVIGQIDPPLWPPD
jgi:outer membrane protein assembly factor BamB/sugar lactone lactonase YvrE